ncbi:unnamed protein product [Wuchereria bancrofti]|uniref:Uncharacterized protein n=1 Tax=Wuchereria bancrofti TaxID=6293 RepID=A0A3P7FZF0_WUCBA|nr:unnamed protein product [Wuchereria bancrofti]
MEIAARRRREDLELARENTSKDISTIRNKSKGIPLWISENVTSERMLTRGVVIGEVVTSTKHEKEKKILGPGTNKLVKFSFPERNSERNKKKKTEKEKQLNSKTLYLILSKPCSIL